MKSICDFEIYFEGYFHGELSPAEELALQKHLLTCPSCPKKIDEFHSIDLALKMYKRPLPPAAISEVYQRQVSLSYGHEPLSQKFQLLIYILTSSRSTTFRIAQLLMLLTTGLIAGWILFSNPEPQVIMQTGNPLQILRPVTREEIDYIYYYLLASEMILLNIENNVEQEEIYLDRELAQKLLIKTFRVHEIALQLNNLQLLNFVSQMQLLLHQIANVNSSEIAEYIDTIRVVIRETKLLTNVKNLQRTFKDFQPQFGT
jgi:hypothetical protein